ASAEVALTLKADAIMQKVRDRLPREPIHVEASLKSVSRKGYLRKLLLADMALDWGDEKPVATYQISDRFGKPLSKMEITRDENSDPVYRYFKGEEIEPSETPPLEQAVEETDISWSDLSLSFLWWNNGEVMGSEEVKGRHCHVIDLPAPEEATDLNGLRLWIDSQYLMLLQAETYNKEGNLIRRLKVKSFKKMDDMWMLKDIDIYSMPSRKKTTLRIKKLDRVGAVNASEP
ncbi:MAG: outer membrane lipoprotein-sorting protein, partial [Verrucomicrobiota bacterium]